MMLTAFVSVLQQMEMVDNHFIHALHFVCLYHLLFLSLNWLLIVDIKTEIINDVTKTTNNYERRKDSQSVTNVILPVVLVVIEGDIGAMQTAWSVLENDNPVVLIKGSGGAADFLSTCYQQTYRYIRVFDV